ncbi:MAG: EAL domain-containing protein [Betaproteobacteria bacterium]|nr:EAL domain-containing protein [Betaproteobacteria bacterium]
MSDIPTRTTPTVAPGADPHTNNQQLDRQHLRVALENAVQHARMSQRNVAVLLVKLDRHDRLDALIGAPTGEIMQQALARLPAILRPADRFVAVSDDKICVLLPNLKSSAQALLATDRIHQTLAAPYPGEKRQSMVRPVIGIACFPEHSATANDLIVHADIARRVARSRDLAQHVYQGDERAESETYTGLDSALRNALRANQLSMSYQPQVSLADGKCHAVEALLRWDLPERGSISPVAIVRIAEINGMMGALTNWVLATALRHQSEWRRDGLDISMAVNLSPLNLVDPGFTDVVEQSLGTWGSNPATVTLEITESSTIEQAEQSLAVLQELKKMGLQLSVDDFGTGYSSLSYVKRFPLDELKIDKMFVQHMHDSKRDGQIVRSVIDLAHNFELTVVAEGVEDESTYRDLKKMGCDSAQGYIVSKPLTPAELKAWVKTRPN